MKEISPKKCVNVYIYNMPSNEELEAQLAEAKLQIAQLEINSKIKNQKKVEIKVSEKGCVQINGIRKFPITFYRNELETIFNMKQELETFMNVKKHDLK